MATYAAAQIAYGAPVRPFPGSWWFDRLPVNAALDPGSAAVVAELVEQAQAPPPWLNVLAFTAEPHIVPASQPLVPVACSAWAQTRAIMALGVPIPAGTRPTPDSDATLVIWQPDYVVPGHPQYQGRYWELWDARVTVDAAGVEHWSAGGACRYVNVNNDPRTTAYQWTTGPYAGQYATNPDSTQTTSDFITGAGIAFAPGLLTVADCARGYVDHALQLCATDVLAGSWVWPAMRSDGLATGNHVREGQRLRLPAGYAIPQSMHPLGQLIAQGVRDYGLVASWTTAAPWRSGRG